MDNSIKIRTKVEEFNFLDNIKITISIRVAKILLRKKISELYEKFDKALYSTKNNCKNRIKS